MGSILRTADERLADLPGFASAPRYHAFDFRRRMPLGYNGRMDPGNITLVVQEWGGDIPRCALHHFQSN